MTNRSSNFSLSAASLWKLAHVEPLASLQLGGPPQDYAGDLQSPVHDPEGLAPWIPPRLPGEQEEEEEKEPGISLAPLLKAGEPGNYPYSGLPGDEGARGLLNQYLPDTSFPAQHNPHMDFLKHQATRQGDTSLLTHGYPHGKLAPRGLMSQVGDLGSDAWEGTKPYIQGLGKWIEDKPGAGLGISPVQNFGKWIQDSPGLAAGGAGAGLGALALMHYLNSRNEDDDDSKEAAEQPNFFDCRLNSLRK